MSASRFATFWAVGVMMDACTTRPSPSSVQVVEQRAARRLGEARPRGPPAPRSPTGSLEPATAPGSASARQIPAHRSSASTSSTAWATLFMNGLRSGGRKPGLRGGHLGVLRAQVLPTRR